MLIDLDTAKRHLNVIGSDDDADIALKASSAEQIAIAHLNRQVYADQVEMDAAVASVPARLIAAGVAYAAADAAADSIADCAARADEKTFALDQYRDERMACAAVRKGIVINDMILAAMLLILGSLHANREDDVIGVSVAPLPNGARDILNHHRASPGL